MKTKTNQFFINKHIAIWLLTEQLNESTTFIAGKEKCVGGGGSRQQKRNLQKSTLFYYFKEKKSLLVIIKFVNIVFHKPWTQMQCGGGGGNT